MVRCQLELPSSEGLPEEGRSTFSVIHSHAGELVLVSGEESSLPLYKDLATGLLECPHGLVAGFTKNW